MTNLKHYTTNSINYSKSEWIPIVYYLYQLGLYLPKETQNEYMETISSLFTDEFFETADFLNQDTYFNYTFENLVLIEDTKDPLTLDGHFIKKVIFQIIFGQDHEVSFDIHHGAYYSANKDKIFQDYSSTIQESIREVVDDYFYNFCGIDQRQDPEDIFSEITITKVISSKTIPKQLTELFNFTETIEGVTHYYLIEGYDPEIDHCDSLYLDQVLKIFEQNLAQNKLTVAQYIRFLKLNYMCNTFDTFNVNAIFETQMTKELIMF